MWNSRYNRALYANRHKNRARKVGGLELCSHSRACELIGIARGRAKKQWEYRESAAARKNETGRRVTRVEQMRRMNVLEADFVSGRISKIEFEQWRDRYVCEYAA